LPPTNESRALSEWLYTTLENDNSLLASSIAVHLLGPDKIDPPPGPDRAAYDAQAPQVAQQYNATILVYGVVVPHESGQAVELAFYVRDQGFSYGSEVAGPARLGSAVAFQLPLNPATLATTNARLKARTTALQRIVAGLAQFSIREYGKARAEFEDAASTPGWDDAEGKEVAYLLVGAAYVRADSSQAPPAQRLADLERAAQAFARARELRPDYARSYLGLGAVALARADAHSRLGTPEASDQAASLLLEAREAFTASLTATEQPATAFVPAKAAYGLGQVHLKGVEQRLPGWSLGEAKRQFDYVIEVYQQTGAGDLVWFAGNAHAYLAWIAGQGQDWQLMADESRAAIELLRQTPVSPPWEYIALYWTYNAVAEKNLGRLDAARAAYDRAIEVGTGVVNQQDIEQWKERRARLEGE
jgi:tetratricopeptide (TPR) repeat protein